jgi:hypothetical protein
VETKKKQWKKHRFIFTNNLHQATYPLELFSYVCQKDTTVSSKSHLSILAWQKQIDKNSVEYTLSGSKISFQKTHRWILFCKNTNQYLINGENTCTILSNCVLLFFVSVVVIDVIVINWYSYQTYLHSKHRHLEYNPKYIHTYL